MVARGSWYVKRTLTLMILLGGALLALWPSTASATFAGTNGRIAFTASHEVTGQCPPGSDSPQGTVTDDAIFTMNPDGSAPRQVTTTQHNYPGCSWLGSFSFDAAYDDYPSYSPSGKQLAFTLEDYSSEDGWFSYIGAIHADGTDRHLLTDDNMLDSSQPAFSPDGKRIVFGFTDGIALMRSDGIDKRRVTDEKGTEADPSFFPNGKRIVFVSKVYGPSGFSTSSISTIRLDGSHRHRLTAKSSASLNSPEVSPDGRRIVFGRGTGIYVMRADGTHQRRLADGSEPVFSPNGKRIAFSRVTSSHPPNGEVIVMNADGSYQHAVIPNPLPFGVADSSALALGQPSWGTKP